MILTLSFLIPGNAAHPVSLAVLDEVGTILVCPSFRPLMREMLCGQLGASGMCRGERSWQAAGSCLGKERKLLIFLSLPF